MEGTRVILPVAPLPVRQSGSVADAYTRSYKTKRAVPPSHHRGPCSLKNFSLSLCRLIYISEHEKFTEKLPRRLCGPASRGPRETLCICTRCSRYVPPRVNSSKGNALRNFLYFHANSLPRSPTLFFHRLSPSLSLFILYFGRVCVRLCVPYIHRGPLCFPFSFSRVCFFNCFAGPVVGVHSTHRRDTLTRIIGKYFYTDLVTFGVQFVMRCTAEEL